MKNQAACWISTATATACLACAVLGLPPSASGAGVREEQVMAQRVSAELKAALLLSSSRPKDEFRDLILHERFAEFEALSQQYEEKFKTEPKYEAILMAMYQSLNVEDVVLLQKLDTWVAKRPSYISRGARGIYKKYRGFGVRGTSYSSETPPAQMQQMQGLHRQAISDLLAALKENSSFAPAYVAIIEINRAMGDTLSAERAVTEAARSIPQTYYVRQAYLVALHPRWGGDYSLMQAYADTLDQAARSNPRIWSLKAEVPAEMGYTAWLARDYPQAIKYYTEALRFGDRLEFLKTRGKALMSAKEYARARADFARYIEYNNSDAEVNRLMRSLDTVR